MKIKLAPVALLVVSLFAFTSCSKKTENKTVENKQTEQSAAKSSTSGSGKAADFALKNASGGMEVKLSDYKGKVVVLDFWATWCPPCRKGIPDLIELQKKYGDKVAVIGISVDDQNTIGEVPGFIKSMNINYPVAYANNEVVAAYGGIEAIPTSFIIDKEGNIVDKHVGLVDISVYENAINQLK